MARLFEGVLERRVRLEVEDTGLSLKVNAGIVLGEVQIRFQHRGCIWRDGNMTVNSIIYFMDLEKTFDFIPRESMWEVRRELEVLAKLMNIIKSTNIGN